MATMVEPPILWATFARGGEGIAMRNRTDEVWLYRDMTPIGAADGSIEPAAPLLVTVTCGACDALLTIPLVTFCRDSVAPCPCGEGADLAFHRRHADF